MFQIERFDRYEYEPASQSLLIQVVFQTGTKIVFEEKVCSQSLLIQVVFQIERIRAYIEREDSQSLLIQVVFQIQSTSTACSTGYTLNPFSYRSCFKC